MLLRKTCLHLFQGLISYKSPTELTLNNPPAAASPETRTDCEDIPCASPFPRNSPRSKPRASSPMSSSIYAQFTPLQPHPPILYTPLLKQPNNLTGGSRSGIHQNKRRRCLPKCVSELPRLPSPHGRGLSKSRS